MTPEQLDSLRSQLQRMEVDMRSLAKSDPASREFWTGNSCGIHAALEVLYRARKTSGEKNPVA